MGYIRRIKLSKRYVLGKKGNGKKRMPKNEKKGDNKIGMTVEGDFNLKKWGRKGRC